MKCVLIPLAVLVSILATANAQGNATCITQHCPTQEEACKRDMKCVALLGCIQKCVDLLPGDHTPQKFLVQSCVNKCFFSYDSPAFVELFGCITENMCLSLPPIADPCRRNNITISKAIPASDLKGTWWSVRGYNPVYDCYPCQMNTFGEEEDNKVPYRAEFEVVTVDGTRKREESEATLMVTADYKAGYEMDFKLGGVVPSDETWWVVDAVESGGETYVLSYYCAKTLEWHSDGAIVFSRTKELSPAAEPAISAAYRAALGIDSMKFCKNDNTRCMM